MESQQLDLGPAHEESPEEVASALNRVHEVGDQRKRRRRAIGSSMAVVLVVGGFLATLPTRTTPRSPGVAVSAPTTGTTSTVDQPQLVLASSVINEAVTALTDPPSLSGSMSWTGTQGLGTYHFVTAKDGSYRVDGSTMDGTPVVQVYDSTTRRFTQQSSALAFSATGPNDGGLWSIPSSPVAYLQRIAQEVRVLPSSADATVRTETIDGAPAWVVDARTDRTTASYAPDAISVVVRQDDHLPRSITMTRKGVVLGKVELRDLSSSPPAQGAFTIAAPRSDRASSLVTYRTTDLAAALSLAGYAVPEVSYVPAGFRADGVSFANEYLRSEELIGGERIVAQSYRDGFATIDVSTARRPAGNPVGSPVAAGFDRIASVVLTSGAYAGTAVHIDQLGPLGQRVLWGDKDGVLLTVTGEVSNDELVRIAEGLRSPH